MSAVEHLREVISERLSTAVEEICVVLKTTIFQYEEEIERQRKLLAMVLEPSIPLHRIVTTQQQVHTEVVTDQQLCNQKKKSIGCQKHPEPQEVKKEEEELCSGPAGQLVLKLETDAFMWTPGYENNDCSEDHTMDFDPDEMPNVSVGNISFPSSVSEPNSYYDEEQKPEVSGSTQDRKETTNQLTKKMQTNNLHNTTKLESHSNTDTSKKSFTCDSCGHDFKCQLLLDKHLKTIREERRKCCSCCGKVFRNSGVLKTHFRIHTGERPYVCKICGKRFRQSHHLVYHTKRVHESKLMKKYDLPLSCALCRRTYKSMNSLLHHMRKLHSSQLHLCEVCNKGFIDEVRLANHMSFHTAEKPFKCTLCGRCFSHKKTLLCHMRTIHPGDGSYLCKICGKSFNSANLSKHMITHVE